MMGGAGLIASFLDLGEIDEFLIHVIPILIGEGIPIVAPRHRSVPLVLRSSRRFSDGVIGLHYAVAGPRSRREGPMKARRNDRSRARKMKRGRGKRAESGRGRAHLGS
jgi:hypothetical protein